MGTETFLKCGAAMLYSILAVHAECVEEVQRSRRKEFPSFIIPVPAAEVSKTTSSVCGVDELD